MDKPVFVKCTKCGKKLIQRMPNGIWKFVFGRNSEVPDQPPVELYIHGNIKMKCLRRSCGEWNILNFLPLCDTIVKQSK